MAPIMAETHEQHRERLRLHTLEILATQGPTIFSIGSYPWYMFVWCGLTSEGLVRSDAATGETHLTDKGRAYLRKEHGIAEDAPLRIEIVNLLREGSLLERRSR